MSKRLTDEGLKVVIRPAGGPATASQGQGTLHAVRAGGYPNRTSALAARDELRRRDTRDLSRRGRPSEGESGLLEPAERR